MSAPTLLRPATAAAPPPAGRQGPPDKPARDSSPQLLPTFLAAAAVLAGSSALGTPLTGGSWVLPLIEVVIVIWLVGVGGRLIRLPTTAVALLQLGGFAVALTSLFTTSGIGGVLPSRGAVAEAGTLLSGAWAQIVGTSAPAPSTPELSFLISLSIGCAAFIADFLVAEARSPALVALPLLCLYSVPASIAGTMLPWYSFALPAVLYACLLAATGQHGRRRSTNRVEFGVLLNGAAITASATVLALLVASSVSGVGTEGRLPHTNGNGGAIGLSPLASLQGTLQQSAAKNVLSVTGLTGPEYLRTVALDNYTANKGWTVGPLQPDVDDVNGPLSGVPLPTDSTVTVRAVGYQDRFLPIVTGTSAITGLTSNWDFDSALNTVFRSDKVKPGTYEMSANLTRPTIDELEEDSVVSGGQLTEVGSLPQSVRDTAQQVTGDQTSVFDKARALEEWFTDPANGFVYSLEVPKGNSGDLLVDFLNTKQGYCEQYAAAMAVMLRSLNIPSRVVVGFSQGTKQPDGSYLITSHDAHAWVEVKFENNGWVRFDPTPPVAGQGGQQGFDEGSAAGSATTSSETSEVPVITGTTRKVDGGVDENTGSSGALPTQSDAGAAPADNSGSWVGTVLVVLLVLVLLGALLSVPALLRRRRRVARLRLAGSGGKGAAGAAWSELEDTAADHGITLHPNESARITANRLARRAHLENSDRARLRDLVIGAEREWYGVGEPAGGSGAGVSGPGGSGSASLVGPGSGGSVSSGSVSGSSVSGGSVSDGSGPVGSTLLAPPPRRAAANGTEMVAAVRSVIDGLATHSRLTLPDRIVPRSLRRSAGR